MKRWLVLIAIVAGTVIGSKLLIENVLGLDFTPTIRSWVQDPGVPSALIVAGLLAADILLPIPSSFVMILSGSIFGVVNGAAIALVGSIAGEWLGFEIVRRYGMRAAVKLVTAEELDRLQAFFARYGAAGIVLTRPLPVMMETMSVVAGLSTMRRATFLTASLVGTAPIAVLYAYGGATSREIGNLLPAAVILVAVSGIGWLMYKTKKT